MKRIFMSAVLFSLTATHALADDAKALKAKLATLNSLSSEFSQQVFDPEGELVSQSQGQLQLEQPRKIRWQQQTPDETLFVSNGVDSYYYDPFAEQVTLLDTTKLIDNTPFILLTTDDEQLWQKFTITAIEQGFAVKPVSKEQGQVEQLSLYFNEQEQISALEVIDQSGQRSKFQFKDAKINGDIDDGRFEFTIPEQVFIDDQREPRGSQLSGE
ncbi:outer membrane lipoprotein chaperone LolA [Pseudoalteromonas sp. BDTF-M6]|uniref:outer membrane lipoprotein chaperone LolA n=1 Tax=Pseudoalteromonas sp. BDTF-M6 TaxID=2796132 RepID=UPI001BAE9462|nr:outer membrane lipoprotein chaperone LolA [Pseudoalteromonas sp. BDTF-M6]MBS3796639.1 outer membrane lipoprotein chaperone LolA [Pseudoalteromonas sp. BDTF-M6]